MADTWITEGDCRSRLYGLHMVYIRPCNIDARWQTHGSQMAIAHLSRPYGSYMMYVCSCSIDARWLTHGSQMEIAHLDHMARIWSCNIDARWLAHGSWKAIADLGYMACIWCTYDVHMFLQYWCQRADTWITEVDSRSTLGYGLHRLWCK